MKMMGMRRRRKSEKTGNKLLSFHRVHVFGRLGPAERDALLAAGAIYPD